MEGRADREGVEGCDDDDGGGGGRKKEEWKRKSLDGAFVEHAWLFAHTYLIGPY